MLDTRLKMIYDLIPEGTVCDIGTDHGRLPVFCVKSGKSSSALACDLREGPLSFARALIEKEGMSDKIKTVLSDGFLGLSEEDFESVDCFTIAGMGGELIMNILDARFTDKYMVLSPQSAIYEVCEYLLFRGYDIKKRVFCKDGKRLYTAMLVKYDGIKRDTDYFYGCEKSEAFYEFLLREKERVIKAIEAIRGSEKSDKSRIDGLEKILESIEREL
jgi:tRNA (adenine22-N1)-methyltransferase